MATNLPPIEDLSPSDVTPKRRQRSDAGQPKSERSPRRPKWETVGKKLGPMFAGIIGSVGMGMSFIPSLQQDAITPQEATHLGPALANVFAYQFPAAASRLAELEGFGPYADLARVAFFMAIPRLANHGYIPPMVAMLFGAQPPANGATYADPHASPVEPIGTHGSDRGHGDWEDTPSNGAVGDPLAYSGVAL